MKYVLRHFLRYFFNGVFVIVPFVLTVFFIIYPLNILSSWIASFVNNFAAFFLSEKELGGSESDFFILLKRYLSPSLLYFLTRLSKIPYINIFCVAGLITFFGWLASSLFIQSGVRILEKVVLKLPGISFLYVYAKEFMATFVGKFDKPVLVMVNKALQIQKIGFIIQENLNNLRIKEGKVAVYIPNSYALSGELHFVHPENITLLKITPTEAWKIVLSGGLTHIQ